MSASVPIKKPSVWRRNLLIALGGLVMVGLIFGAGFLIGRRSTRANRAAPAAPNNSVISGHGAIGEIVQIENETITLQTHDGATQIIVTNKNTRIERGLQKTTRLTLRDLKPGDRILVIGAPDGKGQIDAKLIRVIERPALTPTPSGL